MATKASTKSESLSAKLYVEWVDIDSVIPYANNPRINHAAVDKVVASLKEFGWQQPIVVDKENVIVVGHTRHAAARRLEEKEVPIHRAVNLSDAQVKAYRLADNRIHEDSQWDFEKLRLEFEDLEGLDMDLDVIGFSDMELDNLRLLGEDLDPDSAYQGMPEFGLEEKVAQFSIKVNFKTIEDLQDFATLVDQNITERTPSIWYPREEHISKEDYQYELDQDGVQSLQ